LASIEHDARNSPMTVFHIASVSKQFTAFAIHLLAQEGKLSLDDDIRKYLPELHDFGKTITIRHLIHHTSGLRDQWNLLTLAGWRMDDVITEEDILKLVQRQRGAPWHGQHPLPGRVRISHQEPGLLLRATT
jgi:CubicO group peptidase (beta-lactamase class C family)